MSWTEQQIQTLQEMWGHGFSASEIAVRLGGGLSRNAIIGKAHRMKLSAGQPTVVKKAGATANRRAVPSTEGRTVLTTPSDRKRVMLRSLPVMPLPPSTTVKRLIEKTQQATGHVSTVASLHRGDGVAVTKVSERQCRWPVGDPRSPDFRFCGCGVYESLPYCIDHARIAYQNLGKKPRTNDTMAAAEQR